MGLRLPTGRCETSNSGSSKQGTGPWVCPMQSCRLRGIPLLAPPAAVPASEDSLVQLRNVTIWRPGTATQPGHKCVGLALEVPTTHQPKMPVLDNHPVGSPRVALWLISEDRVQERKTRHPVTFLMEGAEQGAGASYLVTHLLCTRRLRGSRGSISFLPVPRLRHEINFCVKYRLRGLSRRGFS